MISLITATFNSERVLSSNLKSVKSQSFKNLEHIIIDGKSTDNTISIAKGFKHISKIISEADKGIYDALNKGIKNSTGDIIGFLHSDDTFYDKNSLQKIADAFDDNTDCVFGDLIYTDKDDKIKRLWKGSDFEKGTFKKGWMPAHPTFYCRRSVYEKWGLYDDSFKIAGDFELMLRFFEKHNIRSKYIPYKLVNMKLGGVSNRSLKNKIDILKEEYSAFHQNSIPFNKLTYTLSKLQALSQFRF